MIDTNKFQLQKGGVKQIYYSLKNRPKCIRNVKIEGHIHTMSNYKSALPPPPSQLILI